MIEEINKILEEMGSKFRTDDGLTICMYAGHLMFLKRTFDSQEELLSFVKSVSKQLIPSNGFRVQYREGVF